MAKRTITILFIMLYCIGTVNSLLTVTCHKEDGVVEVESIVHNHCHCDDDIQEHASDVESHFAFVIDNDIDHDHCNDSLNSNSYVFSAKQQNKLSMARQVCMLMTSILQKNTDSRSAFSCNSIETAQLDSYYEPLRGIILLS